MTLVVVFTKANGIGTVRTLVPSARREGETEAQQAKRAIEHAIASGKAVDTPVAVKLEGLPTDRSFRNAWVRGGGGMAVDMAKARVIHTDRLRTQRVPVLEELDRQWMRATGQNKVRDAEAIEAKRQALRDIPEKYKSRIDGAKTSEDLLAIKPAELSSP